MISPLQKQKPPPFKLRVILKHLSVVVLICTGCCLKMERFVLKPHHHQMKLSLANCSTINLIIINYFTKLIQLCNGIANYYNFIMLAMTFARLSRFYCQTETFVRHVFNMDVPPVNPNVFFVI